jgi:hypothetical protein
MGASEEPERDAQGGAADDDAGRPGGRPSQGVHEVPLFLRGGSEGRKGDAQDEKDEMAE